LEWNEGVIKEAVLRELERGGQVFFVHNRIETIELIARKLAKLMPQARIAVAHGQMPEGELEKLMRDFLERKDDILLSTTIIESGLDLPNVNTIIIDHADRFGLAELHQLRGRVGRSAVRAYAYLFYHKGELTKEAIDRLAAIKDFTALGSGYRIAMKDLEIRGAGNVLGAEQHGHLMAIGFDLYCQLLEETARELKGIIPSKKERAFIDLKIDASIPRNYIEDEKQRIATYKRLNRVERLAEAEDLKKELIDRYGSVPEKVENLFELLKLRIQAEAKKIKSIESKEKVVIIQFLSKDTKIIPIAELSKSRWFAIIKEFVEGLPS